MFFSSFCNCTEHIECQKPPKQVQSRISMGHSSSAYSLLVVIPKASVMAAQRIINLPAPEMYLAQHIAEHPCFA